ncbi:DUF2934 domain-containing protein [Paradevosia shaoguanensis]|uniref:DUF2934 domain-containing protein n=1 Tax=Paradevosia shaoguanensis TaxID=1335043 RepID=UPI00193269BE|nr:DUF2934 domain-containing protein [Paradevosia shaoguanensis]
MDRHTEDEVRVTAYQLWQEGGSPDGRDQEFWFEAEHRLRDHDALADQAVIERPMVQPERVDIDGR